MAQKKKKNLLVFRFPEAETQEEHDGIVYLFDSFTGKQDFHILILFENNRENLEIQEFGYVTANGSSLRKAQEEIQSKLRSVASPVGFSTQNINELESKLLGFKRKFNPEDFKK